MKRALITTAQIAIMLALLWWIFRDPEKRALMAQALHSANPWWFLLGAVAVGLALLLQAQRWLMLLRVSGIGISWSQTLRLTLIGHFFNLFLIGGDLVKIYYTVRASGGKAAAAFLSVVADRVVGLLALVAVSAAVTPLRLGLLLSTPLTASLVGALTLILGGSVAFVATAFILDRLDLIRLLPRRMPFLKTFVELASVFSQYARAPKTLAAGFSLSIVSHLLLFSAFLCAARAIALRLGSVDLISVMPIVSTISALPISPSGIGVREELFQKTLGTLYGLPEGEAVLVSIGGFLMLVLWGMVGGLVYLGYRSKAGPSASIRDMRASVGEIEEKIDAAP
jgi:uncharacterized protein (TIRG00374 family)